MNGMYLVAFAAVCALASAELTSGTCGENLKWRFDPPTKGLIITGTGPMTEFQSASEPEWARERSSIYHLTIEEGATTIGPNAFYALTNLLSASIPSTVTQFGCNCFDSCVNLNTMSYFGYANPAGHRTCSMFQYCTGLNVVCVPSNYTSSNFCGVNFCTSDECLNYQKTFNWCYHAACDGGNFTTAKDRDFIENERKSTKCVSYSCANSTGATGSALCKSDAVCYDDNCKSKKQVLKDKTGKFGVDVELYGVLFVTLENVTSSVSDYTGVNLENVTAAAVYGKDGGMQHALLFVDDEESAKTIIEELKKEDHSYKFPHIMKATSFQTGSSARLEKVLLSVVACLLLMLVLA